MESIRLTVSELVKRACVRVCLPFRRNSNTREIMFSATRSGCLLLTSVAVFATLPNLVVGEWETCDNYNSIKSGSCNDPEAPCVDGSGCFNAGKTTDIYACETLCEQHPNCSALTWHDEHVSGWANVCVLQTQAAFELHHQGDHHAACLQSASFPACKCGSTPSPAPPGPGPQQTDQCLVAKTA